MQEKAKTPDDAVAYPGFLTHYCAERRSFEAILPYKSSADSPQFLLYPISFYYFGGGIRAAGVIKNSTGVSSGYEPPENPDIILDTERLSPKACSEAVISLLKARNLI